MNMMGIFADEAATIAYNTQKQRYKDEEEALRNVEQERKDRAQKTYVKEAERISEIIRIRAKDGGFEYIENPRPPHDKYLVELLSEYFKSKGFYVSPYQQGILIAWDVRRHTDVGLD